MVPRRDARKAIFHIDAYYLSKAGYDPENKGGQHFLLDRSLMIGSWKILKPWKGVLCFHFCVCLSVSELQSTPFGLGT